MRRELKDSVAVVVFLIKAAVAFTILGYILLGVDFLMGGLPHTIGAY